jgi:hypothetical protein
MIMGDGGQTRRLSLSSSFFWILGFSSAIVLGALAAFAYFATGLYLEVERLNNRLNYVERVNEVTDYAKHVALAPEEALDILEQLDRAVLMAEGPETDQSMVGIPDEQPEQESLENPDVAGDEPAGQDAGSVPELSPLEEVWAVWHARLDPIENPQPLDVAEFKISVDGKLSFILRQNAEGQRMRGRSITICAVADADGAIALASAPPIDLTKPEQGWAEGFKYNIIASKVMRGKVEVPDGGRVLGAEVLAWDEDSKALVFRRKIKIEDR